MPAHMYATDKAANRYAEGESGFYVRNPDTRLVVAGPYRNALAATYEAQRRDELYPNDPLKLEVVERP